MAIDNQATTIRVETATFVKAIVVVLAILFLYLLKDVIFILFAAIVIASAVSPFANWMESKRIPRLLAVLVLYVALFSLVGFLLSLVIPIVSYELNQLTQTLPELLSSASSALQNAQQSGSLWYSHGISQLQNVLNSLAQSLNFSPQSALNFIIGTFERIISFIAIIVISFYFSVMRQGVMSFFGSVIPERFEPYVVNLWKRSEAKVGKWLQGQMLLALSMGLIVFVGLSLLHIKYALLLGIIALVLEIVPIVGPVIFAIPGIALAFAQSPMLGLWVLIFYIVVQQMEGHVLAPLILGKTLGLHPVTVVIALLIGGKLAGILGVLLAVPVAVVIVEILDDLAEQRLSRKLATPT